jgi:hypothetical protein
MIHELLGGKDESGRCCRVAGIGLFQLVIRDEVRS